MAMNLPSIGSYGDYSGEGYGGHCIKLDIPGIVTLWYSYQTVVAFMTPYQSRVVSQNEWGCTTGKHLNWIDGGAKKSRIPHAELASMLKDYMKACQAGAPPPEAVEREIVRPKRIGEPRTVEVE